MAFSPWVSGLGQITAVYAVEGELAKGFFSAHNAASPRKPGGTRVGALVMDGNRIFPLPAVRKVGILSETH
jgi:hypothetical protein